MTQTYYAINYTADTEGDWCKNSAGVLYRTRQEAQASLDDDPTRHPDIYGNECYPEIVEVKADDEGDVYWRGTWTKAKDLLWPRAKGRNEP